MRRIREVLRLRAELGPNSECDIGGCQAGALDGAGLVSVCRRQALHSSTTRRLRRRARMEMNAIATKAMRCSFERSKMVFNRR